MSNLFLAKISIEKSEQLVFTDCCKYILAQNVFPQAKSLADLLLAIKPSEFSVALDKALPDDFQYLDLIEDQHIFATGCTFEWSQEKVKLTADSDVYKKIYLSERSMFFYKGTRENMSTSVKPIGLRIDSKLTIPEAEIVVIFNSEGKIIGHTIGNDVTAVDIEKENPLFQAQAKFYYGSVALLPMIKIGSVLPETNVTCRVVRNSLCIAETSYHTENFNRNTQTIVNQLRALGVTTNGGFLFLGCGASYPKDKGLIPNDIVIIQADFLPVKLQSTCNFI